MQSKIRNFCIIAHIDHGKSTLADRLLELTGTVDPRKMHGQFLDQLSLERERGITIKLQPVRMEYGEYILNLIDTPGHIDFSYEVSRSLAAVEGAVLLVDATQGIQAQTLSNLHLAREQGLSIIPVVNKIDLKEARPARVAAELEKILGKTKITFVSAKTGEGVKELLQRIVSEIPPPRGSTKEGSCRALVFDSYYDAYRGVVAYVRMVDGSLSVGDFVKTVSASKDSEVLELGYFKPQLVPQRNLRSGEIGYVITGFKDVRECRVGSTISLQNTDTEPLPGYQEAKSFVYASFFVLEGGHYQKLHQALQRLQLNDAALVFEPENSKSLGLGFRCGFLGLLHLEIVKERLEREFGLELLVTSPRVSYQVIDERGRLVVIKSPVDLPDRFREVLEPWVHLEIVSPSQYVGRIMKLVQGQRGIQKNIVFLNEERAVLSYEIPLSEMIVSFYDALKSISSGYASLDYKFIGFRKADLVRLDILVGGQIVESFSQLLHRSKTYSVSRKFLSRLKEEIPRQQFEVVLQAASSGRIIAREKIPPLRKNVLAKLYGGDRTRKDKLLAKQKAGKKRLKKIGKVNIPSEVFFKVMS